MTWNRVFGVMLCVACCTVLMGVAGCAGATDSAQNAAENEGGAAGGVSEGAREFGDVSVVKGYLESSGYHAQEGSLYELDTVKEASEGRLLSCFGNNGGSSYMVFNLPCAPNQEPAKGVPERGWEDERASEFNDPDETQYPANPYFAPAGWQYKLRQDEAVVFMGELPPEC